MKAKNKGNHCQPLSFQIRLFIGQKYTYAAQMFRQISSIPFLLFHLTAPSRVMELTARDPVLVRMRKSLHMHQKNCDAGSKHVRPLDVYMKQTGSPSEIQRGRRKPAHQAPLHNHHHRRVGRICRKSSSQFDKYSSVPYRSAFPNIRLRSEKGNLQVQGQ